MPRQPPRAVREAALGRYTDESYHNQALTDARAAWDAERVALKQRVEELERHNVVFTTPKNRIAAESMV